ncbi:MAG TPA: type II toxin-antitoxin system RelE/ParE family toxin [Terriglobia bacterium]|nr:type II toxin-antitoxin system RelE/ParE family toxin [Terriglobia bacterium]
MVRRPRARRDIVEVAVFIAQDSLEASDRFLEAAESTFQALARMPRVGALCRLPSPKFAGLRMWRVRGFENYLIFYRPRPDGIEVLRVVHGARDLASLFE